MEGNVKDCNNISHNLNFIEPEIQITIFNDDMILADSDRCCGWMPGFAVGYE